MVAAQMKYVLFDHQGKSKAFVEALELRKAPVRAVEDWKDWNIGGPFDQDKFLSIVREFV